MPTKQQLPERGIVRVTFDLPAQVQGDVVHLVGDFTGWEGTPMEKQNDGSWRTTVDLEPGRSYEFRYLVDGLRWENDWNADRYVANAFGQENSVIETAPIQGRAGAPSQRSGANRRKAPAKKTSSATKSRQKTAAGQGTANKAPAGKAATRGAAAGSTAQGAAKNTTKNAAKKATSKAPTKTAPGGGGAARKASAGTRPPAGGSTAKGVGGKEPGGEAQRSSRPERPAEPRHDMAAGDASPDRSSRG